MSELLNDFFLPKESFIDWKSPHTKQNISNVGEDFSTFQSNFVLQKDINNFPFSKYVISILKNRKMGVQTDSLKQPFISKPSIQERHEAINIFKLILLFSENSSSDKEQKEIADLIIQKSLSNKNLRDETLVQIANQTMMVITGDSHRQKHLEMQLKNYWQLMALCLGSFSPSTTLKNYLLKYVSDNGYEHYKILCQYSLLKRQMFKNDEIRLYPPTLLEWLAAKMNEGMALSCILSNGIAKFGEIDSWTTNEELASKILLSCFTNTYSRSNGIKGWSVQLQEGNNIFEGAGNQLVLDLIGEIEVAPYSPFNVACFLTSSISPRRGVKLDHHPHNIDNARLVIAPSSSRNFQRQVSAANTNLIKRPSIVVSNNAAERKRLSSPVNSYSNIDPAMSKDSQLNQRKVLPTGLSDSILNNRYITNATLPNTELFEYANQNKETWSRKSKPSKATDVMQATNWVDSVFGDQNADGKNGEELKNLQSRIKGIGDEYQFGVYPQMQYQTYPIVSPPPAMPYMYPQPFIVNPMVAPVNYQQQIFNQQQQLMLQQQMLQQSMVQQPTIIGNPMQQKNSVQPPSFKRMDTAVENTKGNYTINESLQRELKSKELEKQIAETALQTELIRQQLQQVQLIPNNKTTPATLPKPRRQNAVSDKGLEKSVAPVNSPPSKDDLKSKRPVISIKSVEEDIPLSEVINLNEVEHTKNVKDTLLRMPRKSKIIWPPGADKDKNIKPVPLPKKLLITEASESISSPTPGVPSADVKIKVPPKKLFLNEEKNEEKNPISETESKEQLDVKSLAETLSKQFADIQSKKKKVPTATLR